jgi:hypothetical protein
MSRANPKEENSLCRRLMTKNRDWDKYLKSLLVV